MLQACFLPVVALGIRGGPVAGQNFGARQAARVRETFTSAASMAAAACCVLSMLHLAVPAPVIGVFTSDPQVIAVGEEYLRIVAWNFVASGIIFVSSSMFQAMGNTLPSLVDSFAASSWSRCRSILLSRQPGFQLRWVWYLSVGAVGCTWPPTSYCCRRIWATAELRTAAHGQLARANRSRRRGNFS